MKWRMGRMDAIIMMHHAQDTFMMMHHVCSS
jgi:hypothetical protein